MSLALSSPLLEKGAGLTRATSTLNLPMVLSMKRLIVLIFAVLAALEKADPAELMALVRTALAKATEQAGALKKALDHDGSFGGGTTLPGFELPLRELFDLGS